MNRPVVALRISRKEAIALLSRSTTASIEVRTALSDCEMMAGLSKHDIEDVKDGAWGGENDHFELWIGKEGSV